MKLCFAPLWSNAINKTVEFESQGSPIDNLRALWTWVTHRLGSGQTFFKIRVTVYGTHITRCDGWRVILTEN